MFQNFWLCQDANFFYLYHILVNIIIVILNLNNNVEWNISYYY